MIYIETASQNVFYNFSCEHYFLHVKKIEEPIFLLWRTTPTLMVGKYQNIVEEIDGRYAQENHITIARRQSGGGTIYTDEGSWQFTYILRNLKQEEIDFRKNSAAVVSALNEMGANASFNDRNDVYIDGKKICGNARYVTDDGIVHHGSLLYDTNLEQMARAITPPDDKIVSKGIKSIRQRVTNIREHIEEDMTSEEFKLRLLSLIFRDDMRTYQITEEDQIAIEAIRRELFESYDFIFRKNPKFEITKKRRFEGGLFTAYISVEHGAVSNIDFSGDFFFDGDKALLEQCFIGADYTDSGIEKAIQQAKQHGRFYKISWDEIKSTLLS